MHKCWVGARREYLSFSHLRSFVSFVREKTINTIPMADNIFVRCEGRSRLEYDYPASYTLFEYTTMNIPQAGGIGSGFVMIREVHS